MHWCVLIYVLYPPRVADAVPRDSIPTNALLSTGPSGVLHPCEAPTYGAPEDDTDFADDMPFEDDEDNPFFMGYLQ
jgi:hypothetical protein